jgi:O-antigen ligase
LIILPLIVNTNFYQKAFENKNSFDSRKVIYLVGSRIVRDNFWQGIGPANFQKEYLSKQSNFPPYPQWAVPHSHNLFLQIWISFGFFGFVLWNLFIYKKIIFLEKSSKKMMAYFLIYFLIHGLVDVPIWNNDQALFFWFIMIF